MLGGWEWILIIGAIVMLFGASRIPQLAKSLGQARREFKEGMKEGEMEDEQNKQLPKNNAPQISQVSDEQLMEELRRRAAEKQV